MSKKALFSVFKKTYEILAATPLRKVPGIFRVSNFMFRRLWPMENIIEVQGSKMFIDIDDPNPNLRKTFQAYGMNLVHEEVTTNLFKKIVRPGDVGLDLGGTIGYFTL